jgi:hypothetical protein
LLERLLVYVKTVTMATTANTVWFLFVCLLVLHLNVSEVIEHLVGNTNTICYDVHLLNKTCNTHKMTRSWCEVIDH